MNIRMTPRLHKNSSDIFLTGAAGIPAMIILLAVAVWVSGWSAGATDAQPNMVFIMVDDLGKDWISASGADRIKTPRIDSLAEDGMVFHNVWSMPQCTPTRVTLLTGQYPWRTGWVNHWDVPRWGVGYFDWEKNLTFARLLRKAGYRTAVAGKWQINDFRLVPDAMEKHGFDEWCLWTGYETGVPASAERYWDPYINTRDGSRTYPGEFGPDIYNRFLVDFIHENSDEPWMVYYPMALTHGPLVHTPDEMDAEGLWPRHMAMVRYTDRLVGQIIDAVDRSGQTRETLIIFTADNGTSRGVLGTIDGVEPSGGKGSLFEGGVCQPFFARWTGTIPAGSTTDELIDFSDIFPTFAELAGAEVPMDWTLDGHSFAGLLRGKTDRTTRDWILAMGFGPAARDGEGVRGVLDYAPRIIRDKRFKVWVDPEMTIQKFFDLDRDPLEQHNLLGDVGAGISNVPSGVLSKFQSVVGSMPAVDGRPRYRPRNPASWDRPVSEKFR
jgi:arylsulfatase A-like enzyme